MNAVRRAARNCAELTCLDANVQGHRDFPFFGSAPQVDEPVRALLSVIRSYLGSRVRSNASGRIDIMTQLKRNSRRPSTKVPLEFARSLKMDEMRKGSGWLEGAARL